MKNQLLEELTVLHEKVAALKVYDQENATLLRQYAQEFEVFTTKLLTVDAGKFKDVVASFSKTSTQNTSTTLDVHDDTDNDSGFYDSVAHLNNNINDAIETVNSI